jgi:hypothetical protein
VCPEDEDDRRKASRSGIEERRVSGGMRGSGSFLPVGVDVLPSQSTMMTMKSGGWRWGGKKVDRELRMLALALRWSMRFLKSDRVELYAHCRRRRRGALGASRRYRARAEARFVR